MRPLSIVHRSNRRLNPAVTTFIELLGADAPAAAPPAPATPAPRRTAMAAGARQRASVPATAGGDHSSPW